MNLKLVRTMLAATGSLACLCIGIAWNAGRLQASDHNEAPLVKADASMDLTDLYLFSGAAGKTVAVINFAGFNDALAQPVTSGVYNEDALYTLHIDNDADNADDIQVLVRFGQNSDNEWGVQVQNLPGAAGTVVGPVETTIDSNGSKVFAGLREDPFFFDVQGYLETLDTGTLSIQNDRDALAGLNVNSIVLEFDTAAALQGGTTLACYITSGRK